MTPSFRSNGKWYFKLFVIILAFTSCKALYLLCNITDLLVKIIVE